MIYDRYINNKILSGLVRPQEENECAVNAVAGAINAVTGKQLRRDDVYKMTDWKMHAVTKGQIGNEQMLDGLRICGHRLGIAITASFFARSLQGNESHWTAFKHALRRTYSAMIYHTRHHYCLIAGYFEEPWNLTTL